MSDKEGKAKEADATEEFFKELEEASKDIPEEELKKGAEKIRRFISGDVGWAELFDFTPEMLMQMAEFGYLQFKQGRMPDAERIFKVLTVLDWNNYYYHSMMGTILQRQHRYGEAIAEYGQALELFPDDVVSLTNRGEVFMQHGLYKEAKADFETAISLDPKGKDKWSNRARMLLAQLQERVREKEGAKPKPKEKK
ncbi:MAG: tetratricopeptide repeat protein [Pseudomonadota bacterium]